MFEVLLQDTGIIRESVGARRRQSIGVSSSVPNLKFDNFFEDGQTESDSPALDRSRVEAFLKNKKRDHPGRNILTLKDQIFEDGKDLEETKLNDVVDDNPTQKRRRLSSIPAKPTRRINVLADKGNILDEGTTNEKSSTKSKPKGDFEMSSNSAISINQRRSSGIKSRRNSLSSASTRRLNRDL
jgi:hypothetical protein